MYKHLIDQLINYCGIKDFKTNLNLEKWKFCSFNGATIFNDANLIDNTDKPDKIRKYYGFT